MRKIDKIIIHCSATPKHKDFSAETIRDWHVKGNGWDDIGYHYVVRLDGSLEYGRPVQVPGAHCKGENKSSIVDLLKVLKKFHPEAKIYGHRDFSTKACPSYDAKTEHKDL